VSRACGLVVVALLALAPPVSAQRNRNAKDALADGIRLYNQNNFLESIRALDAAATLSKKPDANVYHYQCMANILLSRSDAALKACQQLTSLRPESDTAWNNYGLACQFTGHDDRAIANFSKAINLNSKNFRSLRNRGISYERLNRLQEALADYSRVLEADPNDAETLVRRAHLYNRLGDHIQAEQDAEAATASEGKRAEALLERGDARQHQGHEDSAIADFSEAIRLKPAWVGPIIKRCEAYLAVGMATKALDDCNEALRISPGLGFLYSDLAEAFLGLRRYSEALENVEKAVAHGKKDAGVFDIEGRANDGLVYMDLAIRYYDEAVRLDASNPEYYIHRARARRLNGDTEGSRADLTSALHLLQASPKSALSVQKELASELVAQEQLDAALGVLSRIRTANANDIQALLQTVSIFRLQGKYQDARHALDAVLGLAPDSIDALSEQALLLCAQRRFADAVPVLRRVLDLSAKASYTSEDAETRADLLACLGKAYNALGEYDHAAETWRDVALISPRRETWATQQLSLSLQSAGHTIQALASIDSSLRRYPDSRTLQLTRVDLLAESGKLDEALKSMRNLVGEKPDFESYLELAGLLEEQRDFTGSSNAFEEAAKLAGSPDQQNTLALHKAAFYERTGGFEAAEAEYQQVIERDPDNVGAISGLAASYFARRISLGEAERLLQHDLELDPDSATCLDTLGRLYLARHELVQADRYLRRARDRKPHDPSILDHVAQLYAAESKWKEAAAAWDAAVAENEAAARKALLPADVLRVRTQSQEAKTRAAKESAGALPVSK
jgi:tetratricopeptide (TPR) repeat protein